MLGLNHNARPMLVDGAALVFEAQGAHLASVTSYSLLPSSSQVILKLTSENRSFQGLPSALSSKTVYTCHFSVLSVDCTTQQFIDARTRFPRQHDIPRHGQRGHQRWQLRRSRAAAPRSCHGRVGVNISSQSSSASANAGGEAGGGLGVAAPGAADAVRVWTTQRATCPNAIHRKCSESARPRRAFSVAQHRNEHRILRDHQRVNEVWTTLGDGHLPNRRVPRRGEEGR